MSLLVSDSVWTTLITTLPILLTSIVTLIITLRNAFRVEEIHKATNSMKDALVASTEKEALARGIKQGKEEHEEGSRLRP